MLGILCGLESEAEIARTIAEARVAQAAARPQFARWKARELVKQGATHLLSFGLAGGLAPDLPVGSAVIATSVLSHDGTFECDAAWSAKLMQKIPAAHCGPVWGAEKIIGAAKDKRALYERSRCLVTDMESHCVAQIAREQGIPFAVLRVVTDVATMDMPPAALVPLREDGHINGGAIALSILKNPLQIPALVRLGLSTGKAMKNLTAIVQQLQSV